MPRVSTGSNGIEGIPWKGNYSSWLEQKSQRLALEEKTASKRRKTLERELEWVRMAPKARHAKGKARLNSYEMMLNEEQKQKEEKLEIYIPNGPRLGNKVIEAEHVAKSYPEKTLFTDLNFVLPPNGIVGVIGPNGAGKTTLFRLIMGLEQPDAGSFAVGETVKLSYVDQQHKDIDPEKSVYQVVSGGNETIRMGGRDVNVRAYLSRFNFSGADQEKKCGVLSGGERNRLHLAIALKQEGNVLLLDEPAVLSSSVTTDGSSTVSVRISWPSRGMKRGRRVVSSTSRATTRSMRPTRPSDSDWKNPAGPATVS